MNEMCLDSIPLAEVGVEEGFDLVDVLSILDDEDLRGDAEGDRDRAVMVCHTSNDGTGLPSLPLRQGMGLHATSSTPQGDGVAMTTDFLGVSVAEVVGLGGTGALSCSAIGLVTGFGLGESNALAYTSKPSISASNPIIASKDVSGS